MDGDVVAIELVAGPPTAAELALDAQLFHQQDGEDGSEEAGVREETAAPTAELLEGLQEQPASGAAPSATGLFGPQGDGRMLYGRVVGVLRRNWRQYAGSLQAGVAATRSADRPAASSEMEVVTGNEGEESGNALSSTQLFVPVNKRIPKVLISTRRAEDLAKSRLLVAIDHWPADSAHPQGHYVRVLGEAGSKDVETQVLLHEFDVPHEAFSPEVMACLPPAGKMWRGYKPWLIVACGH